MYTLDSINTNESMQVAFLVFFVSHKKKIYTHNRDAHTQWPKGNRDLFKRCVMLKLILQILLTWTIECYPSLKLHAKRVITFYEQELDAYNFTKTSGDFG